MFLCRKLTVFVYYDIDASAEATIIVPLAQNSANIIPTSSLRLYFLKERHFCRCIGTGLPD